MTELFLFPSKCWLLNFTFWTCRLLAYNCNRTVSFLLWVGYALILVQHHKQTFLEPLYKIQKLSRIDFYWLFYFPSCQCLSRALLCLKSTYGWNWRLQTWFHKQDGFWFFQRGNPNRVVIGFCTLTLIFYRKHFL